MQPIASVFDGSVLAQNPVAGKKVRAINNTINTLHINN
jgi:hypothetical protein